MDIVSWFNPSLNKIHDHDSSNLICRRSNSTPAIASTSTTSKWHKITVQDKNSFPQKGHIAITFPWSNLTPFFLKETSVLSYNYRLMIADELILHKEDYIAILLEVLANGTLTPVLVLKRSKSFQLRLRDYSNRSVHQSSSKYIFISKLGHTRNHSHSNYYLNQWSFLLQRYKKVVERYWIVKLDLMVKC